MEHLSREILARLVDEAPSDGEAQHLTSCMTCRSELDALRAQTQALAGLPEIRPPLGDWEVLEARLRSEGLIQDPGLLARLSLANTPAWMRAAAGIALFVGGTMLGSVVGSSGGFAARSGEDGTGAPGALALASNSDDIGDAAAAVREAEQDYVNALTRYRQLLERQGGDAEAGDPAGRYAALEYLVAASQAAVRQAPADPFLNGLLASTIAEREVTLQRISSQENWF